MNFVKREKPGNAMGDLTAVKGQGKLFIANITVLLKYALGNCKLARTMVLRRIGVVS